jgi:hypothetical protein
VQQRGQWVEVWEQLEDGLGGAGTQTAGLGFGGYTGTGRFKCNRRIRWFSAWTAGGNLGTARRQLGGAGIQTSGLVFGGFQQEELHNKHRRIRWSTWTAGGNLGNSKISFSRSRNTNSRFSFWWIIIQQLELNATEEYDGSAWTAGGNMEQLDMV